MKKILALLLAMVMAFSASAAMAASMSTQDQFVVEFSVTMNDLFMEKDMLSDVQFILITQEANYDKPTFYMDTPNAAVMLSGTKYAAYWLFSDVGLYESFVSTMEEHKTDEIVIVYPS